MKPREKILAIVFGGIVAVYLGQWLFHSSIQGPLDDRREENARLETEIREFQRELKGAKKDQQQLAAWRAQSLPSDVEVARSAYRQWLLELVGDAGLTTPKVDSGEPASRQGLYVALPFTVLGQGKLDQFVHFLFAFYSADHLQQIQSIRITPVSSVDRLDLSMTIEALVLPDANPSEVLNRRPSQLLASASLADYQPVLTRNLFRLGNASLDAADLTYLTAVVDAGGTPEAWFTLRATDEILKLRSGDPLQVGPFHGKIEAIDGADVILRAEEERWLITVGENLAQASALPPEY